MNISKQIQVILVFIALVIAVITAILGNKLGYDMFFDIYTAGLFFVAAVAIVKGIRWGLILSIFILAIHTGVYINYIIKNTLSFELSFSHIAALFIYPVTAIIFGKIGDGLLFFVHIQKKYPNEIRNMAKGKHVSLLNTKKFNLSIEEEIARAKRMQSHFSLIRITISDVEEIYRVFGQKGIQNISSRIKYYIKAVMSEGDKITKINDISYDVIFLNLDREEVTLRLKYLQNQLENVYMQYKDKDIRFIVKIAVNIATFPEDGEEYIALRKRVDGKHKRIGDILIEEGLISELKLQEALEKQKKNM